MYIAAMICCDGNMDHWCHKKARLFDQSSLLVYDLLNKKYEGYFTGNVKYNCFFLTVVFLIIDESGSIFR